MGSLRPYLASIAVSSLAVATACADASDRFSLQRAEFAKFHRQITGKDAPKDAVRFAIDPKVSKSGKDAYRIVSEESCVAITGSNLRGVWYGLYDLLERRGGCHWFWDGDVVPKRDVVDVSGLDVYEESHFEYRAIRYFAHRGLTRFQAEHWGFDDWKREIDWCVKSRLNTFMLRIGQDDLFQRAFPDVCPYPDPSKPSPEALGLCSGYNDRSLFWSLQYRGELRKKVLAYARERGLMHPEDFGTMSHWYSRTPYTFLESMKPEFIPQQGGYYGHPTDRVWDIREKKWLDAYWKLTQASIDNYGSPELLHTIGIAERCCYTNRSDNLKMKIDMLGLLVRNALSHYPDSRILFAGWDFYNGWMPFEVSELVKTLDPQKVLIWDYEGDAHDKTNFTEWGIVGTFPYTFGIFLALAQGLDIRADYARIVERQRIAVADPMCKGYIFWPESSHTDQLCLNYFTANAWDGRHADVDVVLSDMCRRRYGRAAAKMKSIWKAVVPVSTNCVDTWRDNCGRASLRLCLNPKTMEGLHVKSVPVATMGSVPGILNALADVEWDGGFIRRDTIDLARTVSDRLMLALMGDPEGNAGKIHALMEGFTDLLALHTDYSIAESMDRLESIERIRYPGFGKTLFGNAVNGYCASHHYEAFANIYLPWWRHLACSGERLDRSVLLAAFDRPLQEMRPTLERTRENYRATMRRLAAAAEMALR